MPSSPGTHIRTAKSPSRNGVRERSLKYEHLYRLESGNLTILAGLAREAGHCRHVFNHVRPHQALADHRPIEVYHAPSPHAPAFKPRSLGHKADAGPEVNPRAIDQKLMGFPSRM